MIDIGNPDDLTSFEENVEEVESPQNEVSKSSLVSSMKPPTSLVSEKPMKEAERHSNTSESNTKEDIYKAIDTFNNSGCKTFTYFHMSK